MVKASQLIGAPALIAALAWGATFQACDTYLNALGTSPGEVGLSINTVLISFATVLLAFLPAAWCAVVVANSLRFRFHHVDGWLGTSIGAAIFVALTLGMQWAVRFDIAVPMLVASGAVLAVLSVVDEEHLPFGDWFAKSLATLFAAMGAGLLLVFVVLWTSAPRDAARLEATGSPSGFSSLLSLRAQPVCIQTTGLGQVNQKRPLLLLGTADGLAVLRDSVERTTVRVPTANLVIRSVGRGAKCR